MNTSQISLATLMIFGLLQADLLAADDVTKKDLSLAEANAQIRAQLERGYFPKSVDVTKGNSAKFTVVFGKGKWKGKWLLAAPHNVVAQEIKIAQKHGGSVNPAEGISSQGRCEVHDAEAVHRPAKTECTAF
ncbi:MAG: hypothetical protein CMJ78_05805 [Planctomycetaceae bacterium]|nr:hypothetical protein [Planctomycetaceae bacterium]